MPVEPFFDFIPGNTFTPFAVPIGAGPNGSGTSTGSINFSGDHDWFRVSLRAGELYQFQNNRTSGVDPTLAIRNSAGTQLASNDDGGGNLNSLLTFRPATSGTYFLDAGGFGTSTGSYSLLARKVPANTSTYST